MRIRVSIAICIVLGLAASVFAEQSGWRATLRRELHRYSSSKGPILLNGVVIHMEAHYTVPFKTAEILEEGRREELLPYLSELRKSANPVGQLMVDQWIDIVSKGLRGTPQTMSSYHDSSAEEIAVRQYSVPLFPDRHRP